MRIFDHHEKRKMPRPPQIRIVSGRSHPRCRWSLPTICQARHFALRMRGVWSDRHDNTNETRNNYYSMISSASSLPHKKKQKQKQKSSQRHVRLVNGVASRIKIAFPIFCPIVAGLSWEKSYSCSCGVSACCCKKASEWRFIAFNIYTGESRDTSTCHLA